MRPADSVTEGADDFLSHGCSITLAHRKIGKRPPEREFSQQPKPQSIAGYSHWVPLLPAETGVVFLRVRQGKCLTLFPIVLSNLLLREYGIVWLQLLLN